MYTCNSGPKQYFFYQEHDIDKKSQVVPLSQSRSHFIVSHVHVDVPPPLSLIATKPPNSLKFSALKHSSNLVSWLRQTTSILHSMHSKLCYVYVHVQFLVCNMLYYNTVPVINGDVLVPFCLNGNELLIPCA